MEPSREYQSTSFGIWKMIITSIVCRFGIRVSVRVVMMETLWGCDGGWDGGGC
ncbi:hypothetical protein Hanom_Chr02g00129471 [Helianthus anomalus]